MYYLEYKMKFILHSRAGEERPSRGHLIENATHAPHINGGGVLRGPEQHVRGSVPEGDHLVAVGLGGDTLCSSQTKVSQLKYGKIIRFLVLEIMI